MKDLGRCSKQRLKIKKVGKNWNFSFFFSILESFKWSLLTVPSGLRGVLFSVITVINEVLLELFLKEKINAASSSQHSSAVELLRLAKIKDKSQAILC